MSKKDSLKEKIATLREEFKSAFILFVTIITGSATVAYQTLLKNIPPVFGFLALSGFVVLVFIAIYMKKTKDKMDILIDDLEDLE